MRLRQWNVPPQLVFAGVLVLVGITLWRSPLYGAQPAAAVPPPAVDAVAPATAATPGGAAAAGAGAPGIAAASETAVLAGGCFWGVQGVFEHVRGVRNVVAGYAGGERATAAYEIVSTGATGHAESVKITFDPAQISFGRLLQIAFSVVFDPTQLDRQGPDEGTQYRSEIFYTNPDQKRIAAAYISQLDAAHVFARPIVTRLEPLQGFYAAESYHQDYLVRHPNQPYIALYDMPKVQSLKRTFPALYNGDPVLARNDVTMLR